MIHGLGNLVENAVDFAQTTVSIDTTWDDQTVQILIVDDGSGFDQEILARLGEPYVTSRAGPEASRPTNLNDTAHAEGHAGLGLGFFIAKTLLERIGARMKFGNQAGAGARIELIIPRESLETRTRNRA